MLEDVTQNLIGGYVTGDCREVMDALADVLAQKIA